MIFPWQWPSLYKEAFDTNSGKMVLADLMKRFGVFRNSYRNNDPHGTSYCEGQRSVVLDILRHLNVTDEEILTMRDEYDRHTRHGTDSNDA